MPSDVFMVLSIPGGSAGSIWITPTFPTWRGQFYTSSSVRIYRAILESDFIFRVACAFALVSESEFKPDDVEYGFLGFAPRSFTVSFSPTCVKFHSFLKLPVTSYQLPERGCFLLGCFSRVTPKLLSHAIPSLTGHWSLAYWLLLCSFAFRAGNEMGFPPSHECALSCQDVQNFGIQRMCLPFCFPQTIRIPHELHRELGRFLGIRWIVFVGDVAHDR